MLSYRLSFTTSALALLMASSALAAEDSASSQPSYKWTPQLQLESDIGVGHNSRDIGLPQMMVPLWQNNDSMVFTDLRFRFDNEQSQEYNFGLGYRKEINSDWILGGYGFFDRLSSASGQLYSQGTFGLEALSVNNDARVNVYIPQSTVHGAAEGGIVEIIGNQIGIANGVERALPGQDFELGHKLPFNFADVRLYGGGYRYAADNFGTVSGPRGRLEFTLNDQYIPAIPFGAEVSLGGEIEHDNARGTQSFALLKLRIPLGGSSVHDSTSTLDQRMNTFIERDIDIVEKSGNSGNGALQPVEVNGNPITTVSTVNSSSNLSAAVNAASTNSLILVNGANGNIATGGTLTLKTGQILLGSGGSITFTGANTGMNANYTYAGTMPIVAGGGSDTIQMSDYSKIQNMTFNGMHEISSNASHVMVSNVVINSPNFAGLAITGGSNIAVSYLTVNNASVYDVLLQGNLQNVSLSNVTTNLSGYGLEIQNGTFTNISVTDSQFNNAFYGYAIINATVNNISFNNLQANSNNTAATFENSTITGLSGSGNTASGNSNNCYTPSSSISGSLTYNGSSHCP